MTAERNCPPAVATLLLTRLIGHNDALVGDLVEDYRRRQSPWWYWRQVLVAVALHFAAEVRGHWIIAVRGILTGVVLLNVLAQILAAAIFEVHKWLYDYLSLPGGHRIQFFSLIFTATWFLACLAVGWVVARLHHRHRAAAILGLVLTIVAFHLFEARLYFLIGNSLTHERFVPYLMIHLFQNAATIAGLLIGGLAQSSREVQPMGLASR